MLPLPRSQTECICGAVIFRANCCNSGILNLSPVISPLHLKTSSHICAKKLDIASWYPDTDGTGVVQGSRQRAD